MAGFALWSARFHPAQLHALEEEDHSRLKAALPDKATCSSADLNVLMPVIFDLCCAADVAFSTCPVKIQVDWRHLSDAHVIVEQGGCPSLGLI